MIIVRRCRGFIDGQPRPHIRWVDKSTGIVRGTDVGARNKAQAWKWYCRSSIRHRLGISGCAKTQQECLKLAMKHFMKYHSGELIYRR